MINPNKILSLFLFVALLTSNCYSATNNLTLPHEDINFVDNISTFSSSEIIRRINIVDPELRLQQLKIEKQKTQLDLQPERKPSALNFTPWWIATNMALAQIDDWTFRRVEKAALKNVNIIYLALEQKNLDIKTRYRQIDFQKLCIQKLINEKRIILSKNNSNTLSQNQQYIDLLYKKHKITTSDKIRLENYTNFANYDLNTFLINNNSLNFALETIIGTSNFSISETKTLKTNEYKLPEQQITKNPEYRKLELITGLARSKRLLQKVASRPDFAGYISITLRRIIFEGIFEVIQDPTKFYTLFQNPNTKVYKKMSEQDIQITIQELEVLKKEYQVKYKQQEAVISKKYLALQKIKVEKDYLLQKLYEKQQLFNAGLINYVELLEVTRTSYLTELNYLQSLEDYNLAIVELNYYTGDFND